MKSLRQKDTIHISTFCPPSYEPTFCVLPTFVTWLITTLEDCALSKMLQLTDIFLMRFPKYHVFYMKHLSMDMNEHMLRKHEIPCSWVSKFLSSYHSKSTQSIWRWEISKMMLLVTEFMWEPFIHFVVHVANVTIKHMPLQYQVIFIIMWKLSI